MVVRSDNVSHMLPRVEQQVVLLCYCTRKNFFCACKHVALCRSTEKSVLVSTIQKGKHCKDDSASQRSKPHSHFRRGTTDVLFRAVQAWSLARSALKRTGHRTNSHLLSCPQSWPLKLTHIHGTEHHSSWTGGTPADTKRRTTNRLLRQPR